MSCSLWNHQCILPSRRKTLRHKKVKRDDLNPWLSEYQRSYCRGTDTRDTSMPSWLPYYQAQVKRTAQACGTKVCGNSWASGAGDCPGCPGHVTGTAGNSSRSHLQSDGEGFHGKTHQQRARQQQQHSRKTDGDDRQQTKSYPTTSMAAVSGAEAGDGSGRPPSDGKQNDFLLQAYGERKSAKSDTGLRNESAALRLWKKNKRGCQMEFALLPWHQQLTYTILEERENNPYGMGQRVY